MLDVALELGGTGDVDTVPGHLAFQMLNGLTTSRADLGRHVTSLFASARLEHGANDVRNDLTGALNQHAVSRADILLGNVIEIVQRGALHHHATNLDRLQ